MESNKQRSEYPRLKTYVSKLLGSKIDNKTKKRITIHGLDPQKPFDKVTTADVQLLVLERRNEGIGNAAILHELVTLSQTVKLIGNLGFSVPSIKFANIKRDSGVKPPKHKLLWLTTEQEQKLLAELSPSATAKAFSQRDQDEADRFRQDTYDFVIALLDTGARHTEIAKLPIRQIDIDKREIHLYRSKVKNETIIGMTDRLYEVLVRRIAYARDDQVFVFEDASGNSRNYSPRAFKSACKRAGVPQCTFHTLRHTFASRLVQNGIPIYDVSMLLGHSRVQTTQIYAHLAPSQSGARAIAVLNRVNNATMSQ